MLNVWLAKTIKTARDVVSDELTWVAVETEYGEQRLDTEHPNVEVSLNHHGDQQHEQPPALCYQKLKGVRYDNFVISHIDLDVLFGILWMAGWLKKTKTTMLLSDLVALADQKGFHIIEAEIKNSGKYSTALVDKYYAIGYLVNTWVIKDNGLEKKDISKEVHKLLLRIKDIIMHGPSKEQVSEYKKWIDSQKEQARSYLQSIFNLCNGDKLFMFRAPFSLTTAYNIGNLNAKIILHFNEQSKGITLSCFDEETAEHYFGPGGVITPLQQFFGLKAGGKKAIGGTPRDANLQPEMMMAFFEYLNREFFNIPEIISIQ